VQRAGMIKIMKLFFVRKARRSSGRRILSSLGIRISKFLVSKAGSNISQPPWKLSKISAIIAAMNLNRILPFLFTTEQGSRVGLAMAALFAVLALISLLTLVGGW